MGSKKNERRKQLERLQVRERDKTREKGKPYVLSLDRALAEQIPY